MGKERGHVRPKINKKVPMAGEKNHSFFLKSALAGSVAASSTHLALVPVDVIKTRMQVIYKGTLNRLIQGFTHPSRIPSRQY